MKKAFNPLAVIAFTSGFALMAFELVAARILAPSIGTSTFVWTSVIGVIMIALSVGYYLGGKLSDKRHSGIDLAMLCFGSAALIVATLYIYPSVLDFIVKGDADKRWQAFWSALILFAPTSVALGAISPYLNKLNIKSLKTSGQSVAAISVMNSIGSIVGTFVAGFILFGLIGSRETLLVIVVILVGSGWIVASTELLRFKLILTFILLFLVSLPILNGPSGQIDTASASYKIQDYVEADGSTVRGIISGPGGIQSGVSLKSPERLVFWYTGQMKYVVDQLPPKGSVLMLGGGAYTLPRAIANEYPRTKIDAVEIDPGLINIARDHFFYNDPKNVNLHYEDARVFINSAKSNSYDVVLVDVYGDGTVPFSTLTSEYAAQIKRILKDDGVVIVNAIAAPAGGCRELYKTINATYDLVGGYGYSRGRYGDDQRGNMVLVYSGSPISIEGYDLIPRESYGRSYGDNFIPAEALQQGCR